MQPSRGDKAPAPAPRGDDSATGGATPDTIGRYRLLSKIAKGGMAEVFAARSYGAHGFEKTVALKRILPRFGHDPQFVRMMVDEAKISVLLNHPNIAQIFELGEQDGDYFIVMEFVPGQSLSAVVKRLREENARLPVLDACFLVVELLQGLHAAHTQRDASGAPAHIIHRDVSPQNTLLSFDGHVKVIDFGIARARDRLEATEVGTIKGKLRYLAPEMIDPGRFTKEGDFDHRVDVFAAGIVLWELIAARPLFPGDEELKVYDDITDGKTPDLFKEGRCDQPLMRIINTALERSLNKRYASAEAFADELRAYVYRSDPSFTHKRIAGLLDRLFPTEKAQMLALERGGGVAAKAARISSSMAPVVVDKPAAVPLAEAATARVDLNELDPGGLLAAPRDVAVVTIVSRQKLVVDRGPGGSDGSGGSNNSGVFSAAEDATLTVGGDDARAMREAVGLPMQATVVSKTGPTIEVHRPPRVVSPPASHDTILDDVGPTLTGGGDPNRRRVVIASALIGVALALAIVAGVDHFTSTPKPPVAAAVSDAGVLVAVVDAGSAAAPVVDAGTTTAPVVQVVPVQAVVMPAHASVTIDGVPLTTTTTVLPGVPVMVAVSAPGYVTSELELIALPSMPLVITATLAMTPTTPTKDPTTTTTKEPTATKQTTKPTPAAAVKGQGTLVLKTTPWWGTVVIDGKPEEDTTPLTVTLSAGRHDVVVSHPPKGLTRRFKVVVTANETVTRVITFE